MILLNKAFTKAQTNLFAILKTELEPLFNTRQLALAPDGEALLGPLLDYGLPGFTHLNWQSDADQKRMCHLFSEIVARHDQRLGKIRVEFLGIGEPGVIKLKLKMSFRGELLETISRINTIHQTIEFSEHE